MLHNESVPESCGQMTSAKKYSDILYGMEITSQSDDHTDTECDGEKDYCSDM